MSYIKWFKDLDKDSINVAGGKGANLGEMLTIGLPVPDGFAVTAQTYKEFIEKTEIKEKITAKIKELNVDDTTALQKIAKEIQQIILDTELPEEMKEEIIDNYELLGANKEAHDLVEAKEVFVAVRSSATAEDLPTASFAGQQATYLNIKGKDKLVQAVRACWASLFTARAIYYREKNNFDHNKVYISAIVQKMVNSEKAGVMFTINPATNKENEVVIEAVYGLGEMIVSGEVNPDFYLVDKQTREIKSTEIKEQTVGLFRNEEGKNEKIEISAEKKKRQTIKDTEIKELARLGKKIEEHYGLPQDIEWAIENDKIYIVQARAVTTFKPEKELEETEDTTQKKETNTEEKKEKPSNEAILVKGETASGGTYSGQVKNVKDASELGKVEDGDVMVTRMTTPDMVPAMQKAGAIITDEGGMTCHAAIVSREMGIPCVVGTEVATKVLKDGDEVTVNANRGLVYQGKIEIESAQTLKQTNSEPHEENNLITATDVKVIIDLPDTVERVSAEKVDGVGLVRLEMMIAKEGVHPAEFIRQGEQQSYVNLLKSGISKIAKHFSGKPVWVRCSDLRTDEYRNLKGGESEPKESDPMIGWHAIRRLLDEPQILKAEFQAIKELHDEGLDNVGVMLPFVIRTSEVKEAKKIMREVGLEPNKDIDFGVMIETPASCWIIEELCREGISFVSFGTNDLTQLTLGIDRNNERISSLFDEMHPAVLGQVAKVIKICKKYQVKTSICGQAGSKPKMADFLVHQGVDSISVNIDALDEIRKVVYKTERKLLLDAKRD